MVFGSKLRAELLKLGLHRILLPLHELGYECLLGRATSRNRRGGWLGGPRRGEDGDRRGLRVVRGGMLREGAWQGGSWN